jgi:hypothetical protein
MWIWVLVGVAILVIFFYRSRENMTNGQLMNTLDAFKRDGTKSNNPKLDPIYGPSANPPAFPSSTNGGGRNGKSTGGPYPQIFGPDTAPQPGTGRNGAGGMAGGGIAAGGTAGGGMAGGGMAGGGVAGNGKTGQSSVYVNPVGPGQMASDQGGETVEPEFNPDLKNAFPYDGPPQPFLTDFSKILH